MSTERFAAVTAHTNIVTTELNSLTFTSYSAVSPLYDNSGTPDTYGYAELVVTFPVAPTVDNTCDLFAIPAADGTNYADGGGAVKPAAAYYLGSFPLRAVTTAQRVLTDQFRLPPMKMKFVVFNNSGANFPATGSVVNLYTTNRTVT